MNKSEKKGLELTRYFAAGDGDAAKHRIQVGVLYVVLILIA